MALPKESGLFSPEHQQALERFKGSGFYPELISRVDEFRRNGDSTAALFIAPDEVLKSYLRGMLRYDLTFDQNRKLSRVFFKDNNPFWFSKGIGVLVGPQGEMSLGYTGDYGWCNVDDLSELSTVKGRNANSTLKDRVDLALQYAQPYQDQRFGSGLISALHLRHFGSNWRSIHVL